MWCQSGTKNVILFDYYLATVTNSPPCNEPSQENGLFHLFNLSYYVQRGHDHKMVLNYFA